MTNTGRNTYTGHVTKKTKVVPPLSFLQHQMQLSCIRDGITCSRRMQHGHAPNTQPSIPWLESTTMTWHHLDYIQGTPAHPPQSILVRPNYSIYCKDKYNWSDATFNEHLMEELFALRDGNAHQHSWQRLAKLCRIGYQLPFMHMQVHTTGGSTMLQLYTWWRDLGPSLPLHKSYQHET
jgi:hypothetical protein